MYLLNVFIYVLVYIVYTRTLSTTWQTEYNYFFNVYHS